MSDIIKKKILTSLDYKHTLDYKGDLMKSETDVVPEGINNVSRPLLSVPRDLAWHWGPAYKTNNYGEWHYFSAGGKNEKGEDCSIFWVVQSTGWFGAGNRPGVHTSFGYANHTTKEFHKNFSVPFTEIHASGRLDDSEKTNFHYACGEPEKDPCWFKTDYNHEAMTWKTGGGSLGDKNGNEPFKLELAATVLAPGYVPASYGGFELGGSSAEGRWNPATLYGITYYIIAPRLDLNAKFTISGEKHTFTGTGWYEQQYGNCMAPDIYFAHYVYGHCRLSSGDMFVFRQNYDKGGRFAKPRRDLNHWMHLRKGGGMDVQLGPVFSFDPCNSWTSPKTGLQYPYSSRLETPLGVFWMNPKGFPDQEFPLFLGAMYEVLFEFRTDGPDGPVVGEGFVEHMCMPSFIAENNPFASLENQPDLGYNQPGW
jgi:hypothetical protein